MFVLDVLPVPDAECFAIHYFLGCSERLTANVLLTCQPEPATTAIQFTDTNVSVSAVSATVYILLSTRISPDILIRFYFFVAP